MPTLNDAMGDVRSEVDHVRDQIREEVPDLFAFDVTVGNITYNASGDSVSVTVEPSSQARDQLSDELGGVNVRTDGTLEFEFRFATSGQDSELE